MTELVFEIKVGTGPLEKPLGHNGPYIGGMRDPIDRDCDRVPGHTDLFRNLETFGANLLDAAERVGDAAAGLERAQVRPKFALPKAIAALRKAAQYLRDAELLAQVIDEREERRLRAIKQGSIHDVVLRSMSAAELMETQIRLEQRSRDTRRMLRTVQDERQRRNAPA